MRLLVGGWRIVVSCLHGQAERHYDPSKRRWLFNRAYGVTSQKTWTLKARLRLTLIFRRVHKIARSVH